MNCPSDLSAPSCQKQFYHLMLMAVIVYDAAQSYGVYFDRSENDLVGQIVASK
jgi:hypothetical protein